MGVALAIHVVVGTTVAATARQPAFLPIRLANHVNQCLHIATR
jgi:hypothetical protein